MNSAGLIGDGYLPSRAAGSAASAALMLSFVKFLRPQPAGSADTMFYQVFCTLPRARVERRVGFSRFSAPCTRARARGERLNVRFC